MQGFRAMVEQCRNRIYNLAYYSLGTREEAEDVTQDVFLRLWEHWSEVTQAQAMPWLIRVTRNACIDRHRKRQTHRAMLAAPGAEDCPANPSPMGSDPQLSLERDDLRQAVERALSLLDDPYRTIVILREIQSFSYADISEALQMPLNTVKVYLHRGRQMLRTELREDVIHGRI